MRILVPMAAMAAAGVKVKGVRPKVLVDPHTGNKVIHTPVKPTNVPKKKKKAVPKAKSDQHTGRKLIVHPVSTKSSSNKHRQSV